MQSAEQLIKEIEIEIEKQKYNAKELLKEVSKKLDGRKLE